MISNHLFISGPA